MCIDRFILITKIKFEIGIIVYKIGMTLLHIYVSGIQTVEIKTNHASINYNDTHNKTIRANIHKDEPYQISCHAPNAEIKECLFKNPSGKVYILCPGGW